MMNKTLTPSIIFYALMSELNIQTVLGFGKTIDDVTEKTNQSGL
ncbi:hypothetical protein ACA086_12130 [Muriicola sp. E247]